MNEDNQNVSEENTEENLETSQEDVESNTENDEEAVEETQEDGNEEETTEENVEEAGQVDSEENDPEWMKKRLKRQQKKMNERHISETKALRAEVEQMRSILSTQTMSNQPQNVQSKPAELNTDDPVAVINAIIDQREQKKQQVQVEKQEQSDAESLYNERASFAGELQALQDASESDYDPCIIQNNFVKVSESMFDNAMRLGNGAQVLRTICSGKDWQRIQTLPPFQQAREMNKYSRQIANKTAKKTKSDAPDPIKHMTSSTKSSLSKSPNEMHAQDYKAALREGIL